MKRFIIFLSTIFLSLQIFAHGPTPQKVQESVTINVPPAKAWALVKDFGAVHKWLPAIATTKVEKKGKDTFRTLTFKAGGGVYEKLRLIDNEAKKIKYEIIEGDVPFTDYNSYIKVRKGKNDNESIVQWTARFYRTYKLNPPIPEGQDDATAVAAVKAIVSPGLENLKKVLEAK
jgi:hypothetical protein